MGSYSECTRIDHSVEGRKRNFKGAYYRVYVDGGLRSNKADDSCSGVSGKLGRGEVGFLAFDVCMPASCNADTLQRALGTGSNVSTDSPICYVRDINGTYRSPDAAYYIILVYMCTVAALCSLAGFFDYLFSPFIVKSPTSKGLPYKMFISFSLYRNIASIFDVSNENKAGVIGPIHCIRFFSMSWVVMGHLLLLYLQYSSNAIDVLQIIYDLPSEILTNAFYSVDSFFFLSGLLLGFIWFKNYYEHPNQTTSWRAWMMYYVHRLLRLSPPYFTAVLFTAFVFNDHLIRNMPLYATSHPEPNTCRNSWWTNLVYLNNYLHFREQCFAVGWYLASEMQMFLFTPLLLIPLAKCPLLGIAASLLAVAASTIAHIVTVVKYHYGPTAISFGPVRDPKATNLQNYTLLIYDAPYIRCQVYIIGILTGFFLQYKQRLRIPQSVNVFCWGVALSMMLSALLGLHGYTNGEELTLFWRAAYSSLSRIAWGLGLAWIIISCFHGYGGPMNDFMCWHIWAPLGRLTYCGYLTHIPLIIFCMGLSKSEVYFSSFPELFLTRILPYICLVFFVATFFSAFFEIPFGKVELLLLGGFRPGREISAKETNENVIKRDGSVSWKLPESAEHPIEKSSSAFSNRAPSPWL